MLRIILLLAACTFANTDSLRVRELEAKVALMEAEKARAEREKELARITSLEAEVRRLANHQVQIDNNALWNAGDRIQNSIWMDLASGGLYFGAVLAAYDDNPGMAFLCLAGSVTFSITSTVQSYKAGSSLKRASSP